MHSGITDERRRRMCLAALVAIAGAAPGCSRDVAVKPPEPTPTVHVRTFSDGSPVRLLMAAPPYVFSASESGLDRWDLDTGAALELSAEHGLPGNRVEATAYDAGRRWLWVATDGGMTRYNVHTGTFDEIRPPPSILGLRSFAGVSMAPASDGGLWIGHKLGLFYTNPAGQWTDTGITEPVSALLRTRDGWLWIGAESGLIGRRPDGNTLRLGVAQGCDIVRVRFVVEAPGGTPVVVGDNENGEQRVALIVGENDACASYRAAPDERWLAAARRPEELVVLTNKRLYGLSVSNTGARSLQRDGMRLLPVSLRPDATPPRSPYVIRSLAMDLPAKPQALAVLGSDILVGTQSLGTARLRDGDERKPWLRRGDLVQDAQSLTVACAAKDRCFVATGGRHAWRYDGAGFTRVDVDGLRVLAFARSPAGDIYALARSADSTKILVYRNVDGVWSRVSGLALDVAGKLPQISSARFASGGLLWLGLAYQGEGGKMAGYGAAVVDVSESSVVYHRTSNRSKKARRTMLPVPDRVVDLAFLDADVWLATSEGAAKVSGREVRLFGEHDGLPSRSIRGVAVSPGGVVFAATERGVASYDGEVWSLPRALRSPVNDVDMGPDGRLWMATDRGVAVYDGARVRRLDERRGILQDEIAEIRTDDFGRVWARSSHGLTIILP